MLFKFAPENLHYGIFYKNELVYRIIHYYDRKVGLFQGDVCLVGCRDDRHHHNFNPSDEAQDLTMTAAPPRILRPSNRDGLVEDREQFVNLQDVLKIDQRIGQEIRDLRRARNLTITDLSELSGISRGYLSQIERGISSPSVKALHSISRALGVTISWFFPPKAGDEEDLRDVVVRADNRRRLQFSSGITDELLSPNLRREIELLRCVFPPGSESGDEPYTHQGEEAGFVVSGELHLWIGDRHVILREGDSFAFNSDEPHRYKNPTGKETIVIWAITPPTY